jgi:hypothetical protein
VLKAADGAEFAKELDRHHSTPPGNPLSFNDVDQDVARLVFAK